MIAFILLLILALPLRAQMVPELVVNEILVNPARDGYDYIEVYNRGGDSINLQHILLCNRNVTGDISGFKPLSKGPSWLGSGSYALITANEKWVRQNYQTAPDVMICQLSSMPSFPDDEGTVILLNKTDSIVMDELNYADDWHFSLIDDPSGVALERIYPDKPTDDRNNWTSASSSSGYGTPGSRNSQYYSPVPENGQALQITPRKISPDYDGVDDFAQITINLNEPGYVVNAEAYDVNGIRRCYILRNKLLGASSTFRWDGIDDSGKRLPRGIYIIYAQLFGITGNNKKFRNVIVIDYRSD